MPDQMQHTPEHDAAVVTGSGTPAIDQNFSFVGGLLRLAGFRSHEASAERGPGDTTPPRGRPNQSPGAARSSMEAGLTRGASLFFGGKG